MLKVELIGHENDYKDAKKIRKQLIKKGYERKNIVIIQDHRFKRYKIYLIIECIHKDKKYKTLNLFVFEEKDGECFKKYDERDPEDPDKKQRIQLHRILHKPLINQNEVARKSIRDLLKRNPYELSALGKISYAPKCITLTAEEDIEEILKLLDESDHCRPDEINYRIMNNHFLMIEVNLFVDLEEKNDYYLESVNYFFDFIKRGIKLLKVFPENVEIDGKLEKTYSEQQTFSTECGASVPGTFISGSAKTQFESRDSGNYSIPIKNTDLQSHIVRYDPAKIHWIVYGKTSIDKLDGITKNLSEKVVMYLQIPKKYQIRSNVNGWGIIKLKNETKGRLFMSSQRRLELKPECLIGRESCLE